eukprot:scaffold121368_cov60-Phaeocystis_antarctica.AAC.2
MPASNTPWWRASPWHATLHPWERPKKKLRKHPARRGAVRASTTAPDPPPPPPPPEKRTRRLSFNEEVRRTLPLAGDRVQPRLRQYACSAMQAAAPCGAGCDPSVPAAALAAPTHSTIVMRPYTSGRCSWPSTSRAAAASRPHAPPCRSSRWSGARGPGRRRRRRRSSSSRRCSNPNPNPNLTLTLT